MAKDDAQEEQTERPWNWLLFVAVGVVLGGASLYVWLLLPGTDPEHFGQRGDALGPVAAVLSFLALIGALRSVELQRRELRLQREEMALQRQEMKNAREEMRKQAEHLKEAADAQVRLVNAQEDLAAAQRLAALTAVESAIFQTIAATDTMQRTDFMELVKKLYKEEPGQARPPGARSLQEIWQFRRRLREETKSEDDT